MVTRVPHPPNGDDSRRELRITAAPCVVCGIQTQHWQGETPIHPGCDVSEVAVLLTERGAALRRVGEYVLAEARRQALLLQEEGA